MPNIGSFNTYHVFHSVVRIHNKPKDNFNPPPISTYTPDNMVQ